MNPDEQHVALPKLYGAPAYARPPRVFDTIERPLDPDDLPLEAFRTDEDALVLAPVLSPEAPQTSAGGNGRRLLVAPTVAPPPPSPASDTASGAPIPAPGALTTAAAGLTTSDATPGPSDVTLGPSAVTPAPSEAAPAPSPAAPARSADAMPALRPRPFSVRALARLLQGRDEER